MTELDPTGRDQHAPGAKLDAGKVQASLILDMSRALNAVAQVATYGANKYSRGGWQHVPDGQRRYMDALMRHLFKAQQEKADPDTGYDHLFHASWNLLALLELKLRQEEEEKAKGGPVPLPPIKPMVQRSSGFAQVDPGKLSLPVGTVTTTATFFDDRCGG